MPGVPTDRTNLVWKAAQLLWEAAGRDGEPRDVVVTLQKKIPMKAGLGGGSSDAAAALLALRRLWKLRVPDERAPRAGRAGLARTCRFFSSAAPRSVWAAAKRCIRWKTCRASGWCWSIPPFGVATKDAYRVAGRGSTGGRSRFRPRKPVPTPVLPNVPLVNDLEAPVIARHPVIGRIEATAYGSGALMAAMSGSGSTVFGVFRSARRAGARGARVDTDRRARDDRAISGAGLHAAPLAKAAEFARKSFNRTKISVCAAVVEPRLGKLSATSHQLSDSGTGFLIASDG